MKGQESVRALRYELGLTQLEVAEIAGLSNHTVSAVEKGLDQVAVQNYTSVIWKALKSYEKFSQENPKYIEWRAKRTCLSSHDRLTAGILDLRDLGISDEDIKNGLLKARHKDSPRMAIRLKRIAEDWLKDNPKTIEEYTDMFGLSPSRVGYILELLSARAEILIRNYMDFSEDDEAAEEDFIAIEPEPKDPLKQRLVKAALEEAILYLKKVSESLG